MIILLLLAALAPPATPPLAAPPPLRLAETRCSYIFTDKGETRFVDAPTLHVLAETAGAAPFRPAIPAGATIVCGRSTIVPAANDWKVLVAGHPLAIVDSAPGSDRLGWLEISEGRMRYSLSKGRLTPEEMPLVEQRLNAFQKHFSR